MATGRPPGLRRRFLVVRSPTLASPSGGTAGKLERIEQLADYGLNTPRLIRIDAGTPFDDALRARLREAAAGEELMTIRTYHPTDETTYAKGPFAPEIPVDEAVRKAEELAPEWHVLFQEAIDVNETVLAGNLLLAGDGSGQYEALAGRFRVRDIQGRSSVVIPIVYTGSVPDFLQPGRDIALPGTLRHGVFIGTPGQLMTKCPSKYTAKA